MRAFLAVDLPPIVRQRLVSDLAVGSFPEGLSWTAQERWHVTLAFLGDVEQQVVSSLQRRLARVAERIEPFDLALGPLRRFGDRVLYVSLAGDTRALRQLAARCRAAAVRESIALDTTKFRPHVTLARARQRVNLDEVVTNGPDISPFEWRVSSFALLRSHLGSHPRHELLHSWPLRSPGDPANSSLAGNRRANGVPHRRGGRGTSLT